VIHGAAYVDPAMIASQGRIGRSQGCFAFEPGEVVRVMERLGRGADNDLRLADRNG
jgi:hypothetical protein